jgi:hypothetical protein
MHRIGQQAVIITLVGSIILTNSFIIFTQGEDRLFYSNWTINITAAVAFAFAIMAAYRQKAQGLQGKAYASLAIGLGLWLVAELIWTYFELGLQIDTPFPSLADVFWLVAYGFLAYPLYRIYKFTSKETVRSTAAIIVSLALAITLGYLVNLTVNVSEISYSQKQQSEDIILLLVSIVYPILDAVLVVPAVLVLWAVRTEQPLYTHWMLLSLSVLFFVVADSGFGYAAVSDIDTIQKEGWVWDIFYNAGYISIAAALFWHNYSYLMKNENKKAVEKNH